MDVKDFLEDKGIPELSHELVLDYIKNPKYVNKLRLNAHHFAKPNQNMPVQGYDYFDYS